MKVFLAGADLRYYWVSSESHPDEKYIVDVCAYPRGPDEDGVMQFNGKCGGPHGEHGCPDFLIRKEPKLRDPANAGKFFRCKHINEAEKKMASLVKPVILATDPNRLNDMMP